MNERLEKILKTVSDFNKNYASAANNTERLKTDVYCVDFINGACKTYEEKLVAKFIYESNKPKEEEKKTFLRKPGE